METSCKNSNVLIKVNGEAKTIPQITILSLLEEYKIKSDRVVIELNKKVLKKEDFNYVIKENDELEIVTFVGGG